MDLLSVRGLTRRPWFEARDLTLAGGEIVVLSGRTGSGKSLFLRAIADLDPVEAGTVLLGGTERSAMSPAEWRRSVLYLHQTPPRLAGTVQANLERILALPGGNGAVPAVPGLDPGQDAATLSGGEAQLLALHRALARDPRVLLLDEGTSALDSDTGSSAEASITNWVAQGDGRAVLWIAHDGDLARRVGARLEAFP